jgi:crotonobetainyl-CoA:carnitine CoA-transferase CaiB-like acyl-CoA transferase
MPAPYKQARRKENMNLVGAIDNVAEHIALFSSSDHWDAGKLEHCLKSMNMLLAAQTNGGQSPQAPNSDYAAAIRVYDEMICDNGLASNINFRTFCEQRLNSAKAPNCAHNRKR